MFLVLNTWAMFLSFYIENSLQIRFIAFMNNRCWRSCFSSWFFFRLRLLYSRSLLWRLRGDSNSGRRLLLDVCCFWGLSFCWDWTLFLFGFFGFFCFFCLFYFLFNSFTLLRNSNFKIVLLRWFYLFRRRGWNFLSRYKFPFGISSWFFSCFARCLFLQCFFISFSWFAITRALLW